MAVVYENECRGCATDSYPCLGSECPNRRVPHYYCDGECKDEYEPSELYDFDGHMLCKDCLAKQFETIKGKEC